MTDTTGGGSQTGTGRSSEPARSVASIAGATLAGSYALAWVDIVGPTRTGAEDGAITASELAVLPEVVAGVGVLALALSVWRWHRWSRVAVLVLGLVSTGLTLFAWFFLRSDADIVQIGAHSGPPGSFEPAAGLLLALAGSLVLVGAGFLAALRTVDAPDSEPDPG